MSTSKLQRTIKAMLSRIYGDGNVLENTRPSWLSTGNGGNLELDIYIPSINVAIEIQGEQHYVYSKHFHKSYENFIAQMNRDKAKRDMCENYGVSLFELSSESDLDDILESIKVGADTSVTLARADHLSRMLFSIGVSIHKLEKKMRTAPDNDTRVILDNEKASFSAAQSIAEFILINCPKKIRDKIIKISNRTFMQKCNHISRAKRPKKVSRNVVSASKKLVVQKTGQGAFIVTGGTGIHVVRRCGESLKCDCLGQQGALNNICSHVYKVMSHE